MADNTTYYNIFTDENIHPNKSITDWVQNYKERHVTMNHDQSMLALANPDDAVIVVGPPRLAAGIDSSFESFYVVGFVNSLQYSEQSQVQPLKAIGSRRHIFSKTNTPVNGTISKLVAFGPNLMRALYSQIDAEAVKHETNNKFSGADDTKSAIWYTNIEEDIYRIPFGMGVIYKAPGMEATNTAEGLGAEYFESMVIVNRSVSVQTGQTMIMENVSFMADRIVPLTSYNYTAADGWDATNLLKSLSLGGATGGATV
jgi:hypothetical protein